MRFVHLLFILITMALVDALPVEYSAENEIENTIPIKVKVPFDSIDDSSSDDSKEELYAYPEPEDFDSEFRKKCQERFSFIHTFC